MTNPNIHHGMSLSAREIQVVRLYVTDRTKDEIADLLDRSIHCIHRHIGHVYIKLGVNTQLQLLGWAMREGHVTIEDVKGIVPKARHHG